MNEAMLNVYFRILDDVTLPIYKKLRNLRPKGIKLWFNSADCEKYKNLQKDKQLIDHNVMNDDLNCVCWDVVEMQAYILYDGLKHLTTWHETYQNKFICIDRTIPSKNRLILFRDAVHREDYPKGFIQVPCFNDWDRLLDYLNIQGIFQFSLESPKRFTKTKHVAQGVPVYQENSTKHYWYLDNLHKTHYEVFDSNGNHLGEADLNGNLDKGKKDRYKKVIFK